MSILPELHAVIGVWNNGEQTFHVKRSQHMRNYPGVWSLFSIQFRPHQLPDPANLDAAQSLFDRMARQRLNGAEVLALELLSSDNSDRNPIGHHVHLHLYSIMLDREPRLNRQYYEDARWMTFDEYEVAASDAPCGLCMRMWGDIAYLHGIIDHPFIPGREVVNAS